MRRFIGPAALAGTLLFLTMQVALGAKPFHDKFTVDEAFPEELCGVAVTTHLQIKGNVRIFANRTIDTSRVEITWTNDDGAWIHNSVSGPVFSEERLDGTILTITQRHAGVHSHLTSSAGRTPVFDRGTVTFVTTIDLHDLEDEMDDEFISSEVVRVAGPHPEVDSDFELFCEVVNDVLG